MTDTDISCRMNLFEVCSKLYKTGVNLACYGALVARTRKVYAI